MYRIIHPYTRSVSESVLSSPFIMTNSLTQPSTHRSIKELCQDLNSGILILEPSCNVNGQFY